MNDTEQIGNAPPGWRYYLKVGLQHRWWLGASVVVTWAIALILSLVLPPRYKAETVVLVEPAGASAKYVTPDLSLDMQQRLQSLTEQTLSRPRLVQLINEFQLYGHVPDQPVPDGMVKGMRDDIAVELSKTGNNGEISAFKITYFASTPGAAQKVTARLASLFIQDSLDSQQRLANETTSFLGNQLADARNDVERQETLLRELRSKNLGELPEQRASNMQILSVLQDRLRSATDSLHQAERQRLYLGSLIGSSGTGSTGTANAVTPLDEQIDKMKEDLAKLRSQYLPQHPDVIHLEDQIAKAEKARRRMQAGSSAKATQSGTADIGRSEHAVSPLAQLQSQYKANELEITNRKQDIKDLERQVEQYQARLNQTPITEQQIVDAEKNYEQSRAHYESLLAKKQQSEMATDLSKTEKSAPFRIIDPATLPQRPDWPNRLKFSAIGLSLGAFFGCLGIVLRQTADARIYGEDDLVRWIGMPLIGTVPPLSTDAEERSQKRRRNLEFAIGSVMVVLVPALTFVAYLKS